MSEDVKSTTSRVSPPPRTTEPQADGLKPCPFCGGAPKHFTQEVRRTYYGSLAGSLIECSACAADIEAGTDELAIAAWNRRAVSPLQPTPEIDIAGYTRAINAHEPKLCTGCWDNSAHNTEVDNDIPVGAPVYYKRCSLEYIEYDAYCESCFLENVAADYGTAPQPTPEVAELVKHELRAQITGWTKRCLEAERDLEAARAEREGILKAIGGFINPAGGNIAGAIDLISYRCAAAEAQNAEMRRTFGSHPLFAEKDKEISDLKAQLADALEREKQTIKGTLRWLINTHSLPINWATLDLDIQATAIAATLTREGK